MKQLIYILIFCSTIYTVNAQKDYKYSELSKVEDSIYYNLEKNPELSHKLAIILTTATVNGKKSDSLNISGYFMKGGTYDYLNKEDSSHIPVNKAYSYFIKDTLLKQQQLELYIGVSCTKAYNDKESGNFNEASKILYACLNAIGDNSKYNYEKCRVLHLLADLYYTIGNYNKVRSLCRESIKYSYKTKNKTRTVIRAMAQESLGDTFFETNYDSAYYYYNKTKAYYKTGTDYIDGPYYFILTKIARLEIRKGNLKQAKTILKEVKTFEDTQTDRDLELYYLAHAEIASIDGDYKEELKNLKLMETSFKGNVFGELDITLQEKLASYYRKNKNFELFNKHDLLAQKYRDSLQNKFKMFAVNEVELKYTTALKDSEIKAKQQQIEFKARQRNKIIIGFLTVLSLIGLSGFLYYQKLKTQKRALKQENELASEKVKNLLESQKLDGIKSQLLGQNKERERIAKDLHDSVSGNLAAIKLKLSQLKDQTTEIQNIANDLDSTYKEVRDISHDLIPKDILKNEFTSLIEQLIESRKTKVLQIEAEFVTEDAINTLPEKIQVELYTILKELLTNINKHAKAAMVFINIIHHKTYVSVTVEDNGVGFQVKNNYKGIGIKNIKSRLKTINGSFEIESSKGNGTNINMEIHLD